MDDLAPALDSLAVTRNLLMREARAPTLMVVPGARVRSLRPIPPSFPWNLLLPVTSIHVVILRRERHRDEPFLLDNDLTQTDLPLNAVEADIRPVLQRFVEV